MEWIRSDKPGLPKLTGYQIVRACVYETLTCTKKALSEGKNKASVISDIGRKVEEKGL